MYILRTAEVSAVQRLSPSFARMTFTGPGVAEFGCWGPDQRIKIYLAPPDAPASLLPQHDYVRAWQQLAPALRPARRTYTIRAMRRGQGEMDVDFVLHGDEGPASAWAMRAKPGDRVQIAAPNHAFAGERGGYEWRLPAGASRVLIAGDETSLPAITSILEELHTHPAPPSVTCLLELPHAADAAALGAAARHATVLAREQSRYGSLLLQALGVSADAFAGEPVLPEDTLVWSPGHAKPGETYAWVAAEAQLVKRLRGVLEDAGTVAPGSGAFMGYWYHGRPYG